MDANRVNNKMCVSEELSPCESAQRATALESMHNHGKVWCNELSRLDLMSLMTKRSDLEEDFLH